jgi:histidine triad (HIT) family protein
MTCLSGFGMNETMRRMSEPIGDCAFCQIIADRAPARRVYESRDVLAFFPDAPAVRGHTLVIPKAHVTDFLHLTREQGSAVFNASVQVGRALDKVLAPAGMNVLSSAGGAASQTVFHLHVHVLPRWPGDALGDIWPDVVPTPSGELDALAALLRQSLAE